MKGNERLKDVANLSLNAPKAGEDGSILELFSIDPDAPANPDVKEPALEQTGFRLLALEVEDDEMDEAIAYLESKGIEIHSAHPTNPARCSSVPVIETPLMGFIPSLVHLIDAGGEGIVHDFRLNKYSLNMDSGRAGVPDFSFFLALV